MGCVLRMEVNSWSLVVCALLSLSAVARAGNVAPVMLWCGEAASSLVDPMYKTSRSEFEGILAERLGKGQPPMIVFVKDNFCVEDIKHHKESLLQLNNAGSLTYLTSVEAALSVFENLPSYNVTTEDDLESVNEGQLALVQVTDLNAIPEIYNMVRESSPNLIVALTGKSCGYNSMERIKRQSEPAAASNDSTLFVNDDRRVLLYADNVPSIKLKDQYVQVGPRTAPSSVNVSNNGTVYSLTMTFKGIENGPEKIRLIAQFNVSNYYIKFSGLIYEPNGNISQQVFLKSKSDIVFPYNISYHCKQDTIFVFKNKTEKISLKFSNLQVQLDADNFGEAYDCVGFMSIPIWTGIFVTAILALIMTWGLTMIMDIRTMDRFDDPKGKTITISAQE